MLRKAEVKNSTVANFLKKWYNKSLVSWGKRSLPFIISVVRCPYMGADEVRIV